MKLLSLPVLITFSILIAPILVGLAYLTFNKNLPEEDVDISYEEF
ncbi:hypothetical protein [Clostridium sp. B9]